MKEKFLWFVAISLLFMLAFVGLFVGFYLAREIDDYQIYELTYRALKLFALLSMLTFGIAGLLRTAYERGMKANDKT